MSKEMFSNAPVGCTTWSCNQFSVSMRLSGNRILKPLDNANTPYPNGTWMPFRNSTIEFSITINAMASPFFADETKFIIRKNSCDIFVQSFRMDKVSAGTHTWSWDGFGSEGTHNGILDTTQLTTSGLEARVEVKKDGYVLCDTVPLQGIYHKINWMDLNINLNTKEIHVNLYVRFAKFGHMTSAMYSYLKNLAEDGIGYHWTRSRTRPSSPVNDRVTIDGTPFIVNVSGRQRSVNSVMMRIHYRTQTRTIRSNAFGRIDLYYEDLPTPIDWTPEAYNTLKGKDFKNVAAHELGHDILTESMGRNFSWTHKGTSTLLSQEVLPSAPNYPDSPTDQDLMYYYNEPPPTPPATRYYLSADVHERIIAYDEDVRRLIWLGQIRFRRSREGS